MKLLPKINPQTAGLLSFTPLQYMLRAVEHSPEIGTVYADDENAPSSCVVRIGSLLFFGGEATPECIEYLKNKILSLEIYEKYGTFYFFYPNEAWRDTLEALYPGRSKVYERTLYAADPAVTNQKQRIPEIVPITARLMESGVKNLEMIINEVTTYKTLDSFMKNGVGYALLVGGEIQGFCTSEYQSGNELAIGIEVAQAHQRKGYAKAMTFAFLEDAAAKGFRVYWESWKSSNTASINTALSCGFRHVADYPMIFLDLRDLNRSGRAPDESDVLEAVRKHMPDVESVRRVQKGYSTYVFKAVTPSGIYYARFLPEDCSFAAEVTAHRMIAAAGVSVPRIAAFEHREVRSGLSMMLAGEIPGVSMDDAWPENPAEILREAGKQLAIIHSIPVEGFGWIDRNSYDILKAEKNSFLEYFDEFLADDLTALHYYDFTDKEREQVRGYMECARRLLDTESAVLVHGDFDVTHIFHSAGKFGGFIDFGEIRGNNRLFDLATFLLNDASPDRTAYSCLIEGYREAEPLTGGDLYAAELMALFIALRFTGKKAESKLRGHWYRLMKKQFDRINGHNSRL